MEIESIHELVRKAEMDDRLGETTFSKYVSSSMREDIDRTEAYINSKHISGEQDYMGREKPFFNIVVSARNIWYRATDIDRKNITVRATKESDEIKAFLASIKLQEWMKKASFGKFLNDWGLCLSTHGSAILKFIEAEGKLSCMVMDWNNMLVDPVDFDNNIKIEKLWFTPAQLKKHTGYNKELVKKLLDNLTTRKTVESTKKDNKSGYIAVYEVHGELPLYLLTAKESDKEVYTQQMHVITFQEKKDKGNDFDDYTLFKGREAKDPYMLTHLIKKEGQTYVGGAVKNLFEAQWMVNHTEKTIKDQLDLASKLLFQTADGSFAGHNVLSNIENGDILIHKDGQPLTQLNNKPDIAAMQAFKADWQNVANQINNISESMQGQNPPSGSAWRQTEALLQESHSLFELMTENKGLYIIDMMTRYIIPYFKKQLKNSDEISAILEDHQIKQFDSRYIPSEALRRVNRLKKDTVLSGKIYDPVMEGMDVTAATNAIKSELTGNQRFIKPSDIPSVTWQDIFKDLEWDLDIDVTGEAKDVQGALATLSTVLQTIASNPAVLQDPNAKLVFNKILMMSGGISPIELTNQPAAQPTPMPVMASVPVGGPPMATT
jgi:hypothetical protein